MNIYRCEICGNTVTKAVDGGGALSCCGSLMKELKAGVTDAALEKHVPSLSLSGDMLRVKVGETLHPMTSEHYIQTILVQQGDMVQYSSLSPTQEPMALFTIDPSEPATVYEYCNLHGLWSAEYTADSNGDEIVCSAEFPQGCTDSE